MVFTALLAITSNGEKVKRNITMAVELYEAHRAGKDLMQHLPATKRAASLENNIKWLLKLLDDYPDPKVLRKVQLDEVTVREVNAELRKAGEEEREAGRIALLCTS